MHGKYHISPSLPADGNLPAGTDAEAAFVELALSAWRSTKRAGRKALREHLKDVVAKSA